MTKALIFGVNGQDGSYLAELLLEKGYEVVGWAPANIPITFENIYHILDRINLLRGDITSQESISESIHTYHPNEIYNLASPSSPAASWESAVSVGDIAGLGVARLLEAIRTGCPQAHFYQASSSELFGNPFESPQNERTPFQPTSPYGVAKLYAHWLTAIYRQRYSLYAVSGILYNHESPRRGFDFVSRKITRGASKIKLGLAQQLILGNLEARRDWGYAPDYVQAMWLMLQQDQPADFVIGTGKTHTVRELCECAFGYLDLDYREYIIQDQRLFQAEQGKDRVADGTRARELLHWEPRISFEEFVREMVDTDMDQLTTEFSESNPSPFGRSQEEGKT